MSGWVWWLIAAVGFAVVEILTTTLFVGPFAVGALVAMIVSLSGGSVLVQLIVFIGASVLALGIVRPIAHRHLRMPPELRTGAGRLIGREALVVDAVDRDAGTVKIEGEVWSARPYLQDAILAAGTRVQVVEIRGAIALVAE